LVGPEALQAHPKAGGTIRCLGASLPISVFIGSETGRPRERPPRLSAGVAPAPPLYGAKPPVGRPVGLPITPIQGRSLGAPFVEYWRSRRAE
jgi:hypothetical protein